MSNVSNDLIWLVIRDNNKFIVKRKTETQPFSRDPYALTNKNNAKHSGLANTRAVGLQPGKNGKGVTLLTKGKAESANSPKKSQITATLRSSSAKGISENVYGATIKKAYRVDTRYEQLGRASAIIKSQQPKKDAPAKKVRGAKAVAASA
ncbi:ribosomal L28e/Mak16 [Protomyces lactucae-debilis]|uniref:Ribosomal L28e/Mak16 n=1 Tax=Protomyces lactucae-debilis TaxID=2754530 RepID=A0A1Y2FQ25_PROLT|nr:ribosomal L28e/Mak16 [Protomyces lactucae-debilis]ORY86101.1 ribosomal L28e/Mak16 [Protomyces lactucae-debilis]